MLLKSAPLNFGESSHIAEHIVDLISNHVVIAALYCCHCNKEVFCIETIIFRSYVCMVSRNPSNLSLSASFNSTMNV